ncbi:hypothetical protein KSP40_PGU006579 [Platanthera guangdongensis]|uniref:Uncharacterized protein n=1 Tax=Platanthera guangdongensis TaxID=2320717 RepID=A0ABR2MRC1_9ASPA
MDKEKNRFAAAAASPSSKESTKQLKELHRCILEEMAEFERLVDRERAVDRFLNHRMRPTADPIPTVVAPTTSCLQEEVMNLGSEHAEIGREVEDSIGA